MCEAGDVAWLLWPAVGAATVAPTCTHQWEPDVRAATARGGAPQLQLTARCARCWHARATTARENAEIAQLARAVLARPV